MLFQRESRPGGRRALHALFAGALVLAGATAFVAPASAQPATGPFPATTNPVTLTASRTDGLVNGQTVTFTVNTSGGTTLVGNLTAHVCQHGLSGYGTTNFGYGDPTATRCVYGNGITAGGFTGSDYEKTLGPFAGSETTSGPLRFRVGTGSVTWGNSFGSGPFTLQADATHPIDLVLQVNLAGDSVPETYFIQPLTFASAPGAPTGASATIGNSSASVAFTAPASDGGTTITSYAASCVSTNGGISRSASGTGSPLYVAGLNDGNKYTCTVTATNAAGTGPASSASNEFFPEAVPDPPTGVTPAPGNSSASVALTPPADTGDGAITGFSVSCVSSDGGVAGAASGSSSPVIVSGLTNGDAYTCSATATNDLGTGLPSAVSGAFVPQFPPGAPGAPTAVAGNAQATLHWAAPTSGGAGITRYTVTGYIGLTPAVQHTFNSPATSEILTGLTNGQPYRFKVAAGNAGGTGPQSGASSVIVVGAPTAPSAVQANAGPKKAVLHFTAPATANGSPITAYVVSEFVDGSLVKTVTVNSAATTITLTGLATGGHYSFWLAAKNARGVGVRSSVSNVVVPT